MDKLFYENQYIKDFTAEIIDIKDIDNKFHVCLDKTAFFPGGGGQPQDLGFIENHEVIDVYEKEGIIYHVVEKRPIKIHRVKCSINWNKRLDGMLQHFGQHVLSGCFFKLFNANTVGFHLGSDISTVDIEGHLTEEQIRKAEILANDIIEENIIAEFFIPSRKELKNLKLRRALPKTNDEIRVVKIGDFDINACCGVHPSSTLELRMIKIKRWEKNKNATRIEFLAGRRAVDYCFKKDKFSHDLCRHLSCNEDEATNAIKNLNDNLKSALDSNKKLKIDLQSYQIKEILEDSEKVGNFNVINKIYVDDDLKYISKLTSKLVEHENTIALIVVTSKERANLIFASSKDVKNLNMNDLLKDAISLIDGKGGGSTFLAQGAGKNNNNLQSVIDYAHRKVKIILENP
ncbi:alanyl-tRNA editing protein [Clostridium algidicarnis]|uniref:alanyl-tRNA editing protein n=1 Tax=Clostridium algidicarnis TaxID=37659 RepID=UPI001C0C435D|nr:DHHA1 domain-containing protein [Clostridium algidicarnis]MBU3195910.1 alanyl-tRNA editing protein AlaX-L [Clostridium algidicarnis]MBU3226551.1 alanyl-tRNA editing protein AlaX-L [Clostridium algidicarnis]MBU3250538.1 alanyl-tRNA editing protein AlaX-L [Clostridium algidicarnis]